MLKIITEKIEIEPSLKKKIFLICDFCNTTPTIINGSLRKIDKTNICYVEPNRIIINNILFLVFNYETDVYINNLSNKLHISKLEEYIKQNST